MRMRPGKDVRDSVALAKLVAADEKQLARELAERILKQQLEREQRAKDAARNR